MTNHPNRVNGYKRSMTAWHQTIDRIGRTIRYVTSDECTVNSVGVCSIYDKHSDAPSYRLLSDGATRLLDQESEGPFPERGLVVLGTNKWDRPSLDEARALSNLRGADAADAVSADLEQG